jgi:hypothetical protein
MVAPRPTDFAVTPVSNGSELTLFVNRTDNMTVDVGNNGIHTVVVDLTKTSTEWIGGFTQAPLTNLYVIGSGTFDNDWPVNSTSKGSTANGTTIIGTKVVGHGTINEYQFHSSGKLEFMQSVGAGQTVTDSGYELYGGEHGVVQIDQPGQYHAQTDLGFGEIILEGLKATSYSLKPDLLSLYRGNVLVDQLKLAFMSTPVTLQHDNGSGAPSNFGVSQVGGSVVIHADGSSYKDGGVLLAHHA